MGLNPTGLMSSKHSQINYKTLCCIIRTHQGDTATSALALWSAV